MRSSSAAKALDFDSYPHLASNIDNPEVADILQIALDMDDTIFPILKAVQPWAAPDLDYSMIRKHGDLITHLGGGERAGDIFGKAFDFENSKNIGLLPGTKVGLNELNRYNIDLHIMTHRPNESYDDTKRFLEYYNIEYKTLACQSPIDKIALCKENNITTLVDDKETLMEEAEAEGIKPFSLTLPYNEAVMNKMGIESARTWDELTPILLASLNEKIGARLS